WVALDVAVPDLYPGRDPQAPQPHRDLRIVDHSAPDERHLAVELVGEIHDDLHPIQARREHGDHDAPARAREHLFEAVDDVALRAADPLAIDVRAVAHH